LVDAQSWRANQDGGTKRQSSSTPARNRKPSGEKKEAMEGPNGRKSSNLKNLSLERETGG